MDDATDLNDALARLRPMLMRLAMLQLRNPALAEDVVSETLVAAIEQAARFEARSKLSTWVTAILKHKIIDQLRRQAREVAIDAQADDNAPDSIDGLYADEGSPAGAATDWGDPEQALSQRQFLELMQACLAQLPATQGRAFMMREWLELDTAEICSSLGISANHCNVMLFRARMRLRQCIERQWFGHAAPAPAAARTQAPPSR
jgi:RNA polymerase sigma-70 factor (ECF subfamily)